VFQSVIEFGGKMPPYVLCTEIGLAGRGKLFKFLKSD